MPPKQKVSEPKQKAVRKRVVIISETETESEPEPTVMPTEPVATEVKQRRTKSFEQSSRKKREVNITDDLKQFIDNNGLRCQKCGVRTKNKNARQDTISGKSEGKSREIIRAECEKCGSKKTQFGNLEKLVAKLNISK